MPHDPRELPYGADTIVVPFIFVPHGSPLPVEWLAEHPGAVRIPAMLVPRRQFSEISDGPDFELWPLIEAREDEQIAAHSAVPLAATDPVPFVDDRGDQVMDWKGHAMLRPAGLDPQVFVEEGSMDARTEWEAARYGGENGAAAVLSQEYSALSRFQHWGQWDAQRLGGQNRPEFVDYSTVAIGLYAAASGMSREDILRIENAAAVFSTFAPRTVFDKD